MKNPIQKAYNYSIILILLLVISACQAPEVFLGEAIIWENTSVYAQDRTFTVANLSSTISESPVFQIEDELELALLTFIQTQDDIYSLYYISDHDLSIDEVYAYLESVLPFSFTLNIKSFTYTHQDEPLIVLYQIMIESVLVSPAEVTQASLAYLQNINLEFLNSTQSIRKIHDTLILNTAYDESVLELDISTITDHLSFEAYGLMTTGLAVCSGYARAFNALAQLSDIPSIMISAVNMQHAFNMVYDGNVWLFLDVTFNDPIPDRSGRVLSTFYMLDERSFLALGKHHFDDKEEGRLTLEQYREFAYALFPDTRR